MEYCVKNDWLKRNWCVTNVRGSVQMLGIWFCVDGTALWRTVRNMAEIFWYKAVWITQLDIWDMLCYGQRWKLLSWIRAGSNVLVGFVPCLSLCLNPWDIARLLIHYGGQQLRLILTKMNIGTVCVRCAQRNCWEHFLFHLRHEIKKCFMYLLSGNCNSFNLRTRWKLAIFLN
jgi:hypothetical protein